MHLYQSGVPLPEHHAPHTRATQRPLGDRGEGDHESERRPGLSYRRLGFAGRAYGFLSWGAAELHLSRFPELSPATTTSACYLYVNDADALHTAWRDRGVAGRLHAPEDTPS